MRSYSHNTALERVPASPAFDGLGLDGLCHCLNCMSGQVLEFDGMEEIKLPAGCSVLCAVLDGSAILTWRDSGEEISILPRDRVFSYSASISDVYALMSAPGLRLLVFDSARAAIPCGNNCMYHLTLMRSIAAMMMRRDLDPVRE